MWMGNGARVCLMDLILCGLNVTFQTTWGLVKLGLTLGGKIVIIPKKINYFCISYEYLVNNILYVQ